MITFEEQIRNENIKDIANKLMCAARTAPKARGTDNLVLAVATDETIVEIAEKMKQLAIEREMEFLNRDAENILQCGAVILFGMKISPLGLNCAACGFPTCGAKPKNVPCFFNANDLGIAIGSAVSLAADMRVDSRVMFSVGQAVLDLNLLPECSMILALPLSVSGKSIFFDRVKN
jgi:uncharacterized ferredoxin-like protein